MKFLFAIIGILCLSSCTWQHQNKSPIRTADTGNLMDQLNYKKVIRVGVKTNAPPFAKQEDDGSYWGFDIDMAKAIGKELGLRVQFVPVSPNQRIPYVREGRVDIVVASMTITRYREQFVDFSIPYFQDGQGLLFRSNSKFTSYRDLKDRKVGAVIGSTSYKNMVKVQPDCKIVPFENYADGVQALLDEKTDAFTSDYLILMGLKNKHKDHTILELRGNRFTAEPYGVAMMENQSKLRDNVNNAIMSIWENGIWQEIYQTWFGEGSVFQNQNDFHIEVTP